jgi:hypothetical protein
MRKTRQTQSDILKRPLLNCAVAWSADLLFKASAETLTTIAADPKHPGARVGITSVLHSWGSALTHHPHVHMIVPGGGISRDGLCWVVSIRSGPRPAYSGGRGSNLAFAL